MAGAPRAERRWGRQVWAVLRTGFLVGAFTAMMQGAIFDTYLSVLPGGSNTFVGTVESIRGIVALSAAVPLGWAVDRWPKPGILRWNVVLALASAVPFTVGVALNSVPLIILGCIGFSLHNQCFSGGIPALLADITEPGLERTEVLSTFNSLRSLGMASGPLAQFLLTTALGARTWTPGELHWIICSGPLLLIPYAVALRPVWSRGPAAGRECLETGLGEPTSGIPAAVPMRAEPSTTADERSAAAPSLEVPRPVEQQPPSSQARRWLVAVLVELAAIIQFLGGGMTFKFFPLFFKKDFGFSPAQVCLFALGLWLMVAGGCQVAPKVAKRVGRMPTVLCSMCVASGLLFWVASGVSAWLSLLLVLLRAAFSQSNMPIMQALILDMVPPRHRGKWSAIVSLRRTSFAVSAFIGGELSDHHDYRFAFAITATMSLVSCSVLLPTLFLRI